VALDERIPEAAQVAVRPAVSEPESIPPEPELETETSTATDVPAEEPPPATDPQAL
jgi:hypothetical protein